MGTVYADITIKNAKDIMKAEEGFISENDVREKAVKALVDTGAHGEEIVSILKYAQYLETMAENNW